MWKSMMRRPCLYFERGDTIYSMNLERRLDSITLEQPMTCREVNPSVNCVSDPQRCTVGLKGEEGEFWCEPGDPLRRMMVRPGGVVLTMHPIMCLYTKKRNGLFLESTVHLTQRFMHVPSRIEKNKVSDLLEKIFQGYSALQNGHRSLVIDNQVLLNDYQSCTGRDIEEGKRKRKRGKEAESTTAEDGAQDDGRGGKRRCVREYECCVAGDYRAARGKGENYVPITEENDIPKDLGAYTTSKWIPVPAELGCEVTGVDPEAEGAEKWLSSLSCGSG